MRLSRKILGTLTLLKKGTPFQWIYLSPKNFEFGIKSARVIFGEKKLRCELMAKIININDEYVILSPAVDGWEVELMKVERKFFTYNNYEKRLGS